VCLRIFPQIGLFIVMQANKLGAFDESFRSAAMTAAVTVMPKEAFVPVQRAVISVYDKTGLAEFARRLAQAKVEIVSTGGTAKALRDAGVKVRDVSELTGWPEMLGGRVKTLHPKIHGGILYQRGKKQDLEEAQGHEIAPIDLVVVNLYPFSAVARKQGVTPEEMVENIDIGGPAMLRSAAKNFASVAVVTDPSQYDEVATELEKAGELSLKTRLGLARQAYARTSEYDGMITTELERLEIEGAKEGAAKEGAAKEGAGLRMKESETLPERLHFSLQRQQTMRYGENPHQSAALYIPAGKAAGGLAGAKQLQGKELSYNNLVDLDAAWQLAKEFKGPAAVIIKHNNPCGAAQQEELEKAYKRALACDPISAFGGVLAFNRALDQKTAEEVAKLFVECIVAPSYEQGVVEKFASKKNVRLLEIGPEDGTHPLELKRISGGVLVQTPDTGELDAKELKVVSERKPTDAEMKAMLFGWKVCKHVKSNAIVFAHDGFTAAIGAGQMSRVDSVKLAIMKAQLPIKGSVMASDAFFPFPDSVEEGAKAGATAVIQPGGSIRDGDSIAAANKTGMAMVLTGVRHFRH
jgi:phosphoribosylaminoimidazolecarboxamide formyltransferase / IMP cyclohydrolase